MKMSGSSFQVCPLSSLLESCSSTPPHLVKGLVVRCDQNVSQTGTLVGRRLRSYDTATPLNASLSLWPSADC